MSKHLVSSTPGPASYNPPSTFGNKKVSGPMFSMSGKPRDFAKIKIVEGPGPGSHVHPMPVSNGPKYSFGGKPRDRHMLDDSAPGPGKYFSSVPTMMGKEGPKFSVKGPGRYEPLVSFEKTKTHGASYSLQGRPRQRSMSGSNPAPGQYNPHTIDPIGGKNTTKYSMTGKPRDFSKIKISDTPGPGSHVWEPKQAGPKFSIAQRTREFQSTYVDSSNVKTLGLRHPILNTQPSTRKVEPQEMAKLQQQLRSTIISTAKTMTPVVSIPVVA